MKEIEPGENPSRILSELETEPDMSRGTPVVRIRRRAHVVRSRVDEHMQSTQSLLVTICQLVCGDESPVVYMQQNKAGSRLNYDVQDTL